MEAEVYANMADQQKSHWWFRARREILSCLIGELNLAENSSILEIGCGPGGNLDMLKDHGRVSAIERDDNARMHAGRLTGIDVRKGSLPDDIDVSGEQYDLVCFFDVLEHIEDDLAALLSAKKLLKENGRLIITVPAHQWLYGPHDHEHHHFRRYSRKDIIARVEAAGMNIKRISYFNCLLFPLLVIFRVVAKLAPGLHSGGSSIPSPPVNMLLYQIFRAERILLMQFNFPFGASIVTVLTNNRDI